MVPSQVRSRSHRAEGNLRGVARRRVLRAESGDEVIDGEEPKVGSLKERQMWGGAKEEGRDFWRRRKWWSPDAGEAELLGPVSARVGGGRVLGRSSA